MRKGSIRYESASRIFSRHRHTVYSRSPFDDHSEMFYTHWHCHIASHFFIDRWYQMRFECHSIVTTGQKKKVENGRTPVTIRAIPFGCETVKFRYHLHYSAKPRKLEIFSTFFSLFSPVRLTHDFSDVYQIILMMFCMFFIVGICSQLLLIELRMVIYLPNRIDDAFYSILLCSALGWRQTYSNNRDNRFIRSSDRNKFSIIRNLWVRRTGSHSVRRYQMWAWTAQMVSSS